MDRPTPLAPLRGFRDALYACFDRRAAALFELTDALLAIAPVPALPHLSLTPLHRRGWGSTYDALAAGRLDVDALRMLLARFPLAAGQPVYAVDLSVWPRCDAEASPERGFYYHPSRHSAGQPIVAGWLYQWVAQLGFARESWTAPVDARRVRPTENIHAVAADQIRDLLSRRPPLGRRCPSVGADHPLSTCAREKSVQRPPSRADDVRGRRPLVHDLAPAGALGGGRTWARPPTVDARVRSSDRPADRGGGG